MIKFPIKHSFLVPTSEGNSSLLINKTIENIEQLYYYLYLSAVSLPDEGMPNVYAYSFRENKKYQIDLSTSDDFDYIYNTGEEFIIVTKLESITSIDFKLIPSISSFSIYTPTKQQIIINNSTSVNNSPITTIKDLKLGRKFTSLTSHRFINISKIFSKEVQVNLSCDKPADYYFYIHIDKPLFIKWMRERFNGYIDDKCVIFDYGAYVENQNKISLTPTIYATNCDIKKMAVFEKRFKNITSLLPMRYYNPIQISDSDIMLGFGQTLFSYLYNPYGDYIYKYYFDNCFINGRIIPLNTFENMYLADLDKNIIRYRIIISSLKFLKNIYFLRKIPGLISIKFSLFQFPSKDIDLDNFINVSDLIHYDIIISEEDFIYNRYKRRGYIECEVPRCSDTYCPILKINTIYNNNPVDNIYLVCDLEIDPIILFHTINISNSDFDLWNTASPKQTAKFLIDEYSISSSPTPIPINSITHSLLSDQYYYYFNDFDGVLVSNFTLSEFKLFLTKDVERVVFFKNNTSDYSLRIRHDNFDQTFTQDSIQTTDDIYSIIYSKYMFMDVNERLQFDYKFDILNGQLLRSYFQNYYANTPIPSQYNIINANQYTDKNFVIYKNPNYNIKDSIMTVNSNLPFKIYVKRDNKNHKKISKPYKLV